MKRVIKYQLSKIGIWPHFDLVRQLPQIIRWMGAGCTGMAPLG